MEFSVRFECKHKPELVHVVLKLLLFVFAFRRDFSIIYSLMSLKSLLRIKYLLL